MGRVRNFGTPGQGAYRYGGANPVDTDFITIGDKSYEWDNNAAVTAGRVLVTIGGSVAASITNLIAAINANPSTVPVVASADPVDALTVRIKASANGANGNLPISENQTDAANIVSGAAMTGGVNPGNYTLHKGSYVVTALDVLATNVVIETGLSAPVDIQTERYRAGELLEAVTGVVTVVGSQIRHDFAGATDLQAGDVIRWSAWE